MKMKNVTHTFTHTFLSVLLCFGLFSFSGVKAQGVVYDNFEGVKVVYYHEKGGVLDTLAKNPAVGDVNKSAKCGLYVRNSSRKFDNIKMGLAHNLLDVEKYATYVGIPPRFKMKVYTSAPAGTLVEILLGSRKGNNDYPSGTHSQYQAYTKVSNQWHELEFLFSQIPQGSETSASQIDQLVLLFNPNSSTSDSYYFDDLTGPPIGTQSTGSTGAVAPQQETGEGTAIGTTKPEINPAATDAVAEPAAAPKKTKKKK
jgi:hypothetical protein